MTRLLLAVGIVISIIVALSLLVMRPSIPPIRVDGASDAGLRIEEGRVSATSASGAVDTSVRIRISQAREHVEGQLLLLGAAGLKPALEALSASYSRLTGNAVTRSYGGTAQLLPGFHQGLGDLLVAADAMHMKKAKAAGVVREVFELARQRPVIAVRKGNPRGLRGLDDLMRGDVRYGLPHPESAGLGSLLRRELGPRWTALSASSAVVKPTVPDLFADLRAQTLDAIIVWDANLLQLAEAEEVPDPALARLSDAITLGISASTANPAAAIQFARFMTSPEHAAAIWARHGYAPIPGDAWAVRQNLLLYAGAVNKNALVDVLRRFAQREGIELDTVYNGCGILCADMEMAAKQKTSRMPDVYYACDVCFVAPVAEHFPRAVLLTETRIGIAVPKGNPKGIATLVDLAMPGMRVALGNAQQSTLGYMTSRMLAALNLRKAVMANAVYQTATGDLVAAQLRFGAVDAAIVYEINVRAMRDAVDFIPINHPGARAVQPFAVRQTSPSAQAGARMLAFLRANQRAFLDAGFRWIDDGVEHDSRTFPADPAAKEP